MLQIGPYSQQGHDSWLYCRVEHGSVVVYVQYPYLWRKSLYVVWPDGVCSDLP